MLVQSVFDSLATDAAQIATTTGYDAEDGKPFSFSNYPTTKMAVQELQRRYVADVGSIVMQGTSAEWKKSNLMQDALVDGLLRSYDAQHNGDNYNRYYQTNSPQLKAFQQRVEHGMNLSDNLWDKSNGMKEEMEQAISAGIEKGMSTVTLSKCLSKYLHNFDELQEDYKERFGTATTCKNCEYASVRLARNEINMAYRKAEQIRWEQMDFVVGYEIKTTQNGHHASDICDQLVGKYPKDFDWNGWHPNCYSDDSKVLTNHGWKLFPDVEDSDLIFSLNPETRNVEYVPFVMKQCYEKHGKMVHFYNRNLDCLVTPDHQMVYLNKSNGEIRKCTAEEYSQGKGGFYRSSEYNNRDIETIKIGGMDFDFDWFCEFMGYWLSDGSTIRKSQVVITQQNGQGCCKEIEALLSKQGIKYHQDDYGYSFYCADLCQYLKQFGTCVTKNIPTEIMNASRRQIEIFLSAFVKCDGYIKKPHSFVGNRGNLFVSSRVGRQFFTTSSTMAGQLSELLIKIGHRPSVKETQPSTAIKKDGSAINGNHVCYTINDCYSSTSTVFEKEYVDYDGNVYDLTLERNHIMYVCRNGRCYWGSNCMCYRRPLLKTESEFWADGSEETTNSINEIKDVPGNFREWMRKNKDRVNDAKNIPYFIKDNADFLINDLTYNKIVEIARQNGRLSLAQIKSLTNENENLISEDIFYIDGVRVKSRDNVYNEIIDEYLKEYHPVETEYVYMLGGAPASGKSTVTNSGLIKYPEGSVVIDADSVKAKLQEYKLMVNSGEKKVIDKAANFVHEESSTIGKMIQSRAFGENLSVVIDGVNGGKIEKIRGKIEQIREKSNKKIRADYVTADTEECVRRSAERAKKTGRIVPEKLIRYSNENIASIVPKCIEQNIFDELYLWDTNSSGEPILILSCIDGELHIKNKELYVAFLKKSKENIALIEKLTTKM